MNKDLKKQSKGITLIALVVTIVVLLILASIGINTLTGDGGIINQTKQGKDSAEISEEKEIIDISVVQAMDEDVMGNLEIEILKKKLNNNTGEGKTEVIDGLGTIVVKFVEKNRYYEIDKQGNAEGPKELIKDENAGDLSKGGTADGSEENPFQINCIEDLVTFSMMVNGGNTELGISYSNFSGKTVILTRTLDFKSIFSYNDYITTQYGDLNTDGVIEDIRTELTKTEEGCIGFTPIGYIGAKTFAGTFDGQTNEIKNIYENFDKNHTNIRAGLFGQSNGKIKNIAVTGYIYNDTWVSAGICAGRKC